MNNFDKLLERFKGRPSKHGRDMKKAKWMGDFEAKVIAIEPAFQGRIPWDEVQHFFNVGDSSGIAAGQFTKHNKPESRKGFR